MSRFFPAGKGLVFISFLFSVECKSIISQIIGHMRFYDLVHSYVEQCMVLNLLLNTPLGPEKLSRYSQNIVQNLINMKISLVLISHKIKQKQLDIYSYKNIFSGPRGR